jgi:hypothetical protein
MKNQVFLLITVGAIALGIAGIWFLYFAVSEYTRETARTPALISGITCLVLATGMVGLAVYYSRRQD